jgi:hypothetical protein
MIEPLPPVPLDPHSDRDEIERLEFHIERLESILRENGLGDLIPEQPPTIAEARQAFMAADLPWLSPEAQEAFQGVPENHGTRNPGIISSPLLEAARRRLEELPPDFLGRFANMELLPLDVPEIIGPTKDEDGDTGC